MKFVVPLDRSDLLDEPCESGSARAALAHRTVPGERRGLARGAAVPGSRLAGAGESDLEPAVRERLESYRRWCRENGGDRWAAVVIQHGRMIFQGRGPRSHIHQRHDCGSIKKSLQGTVLGTALYQERLASFDENALPYWKDAWQTPYENDRVISCRRPAGCLPTIDCSLRYLGQHRCDLFVENVTINIRSPAGLRWLPVRWQQRRQVILVGHLYNNVGGSRILNKISGRKFD
jgi:hypothetical protein